MINYEKLGFENEKEYLVMINSINLSNEQVLNAFKKWRKNDGSKKGLLKIIELESELKKDVIFIDIKKSYGSTESFNPLSSTHKHINLLDLPIETSVEEIKKIIPEKDKQRIKEMIELMKDNFKASNILLATLFYGQDANKVSVFLKICQAVDA